MEQTPSRRPPADAYVVTEDGLRALQDELDELGRAVVGQQVAAELPNGSKRKFRIARVRPPRPDEDLRAAS